MPNWQNLEKQLRAEALFSLQECQFRELKQSRSVKLNFKEENFEIADIGGTYIFKPQSMISDEMKTKYLKLLDNRTERILGND